MNNEEKTDNVQRVILAVRGILFQVSAGGVLLLRRSEDSEFSPGMWELPGGKLEDNSMSFDMAIEREFMEETGIPIVAAGPPVHTWDKPAGLPPKYPGNVRYLCSVVRVHLLYPYMRDVQLSSEHNDFAWVQPTPESLIPYGDAIPKETRDALELFYQNFIWYPGQLLNHRCKR